MIELIKNDVVLRTSRVDGVKLNAVYKCVSFSSYVIDTLLKYCFLIN